MRIILKRSGGFAGIGQTMSISTDQMPSDEAQKVTSLVQQAGFFALPPVIESTQPRADRFQYQISVDGEQGAHSVQVDESAVPPGLQPLLDWMKNSARRQAGK